MSLLAADGTPLAPLIRLHVNWTGATPDRLERLNMILGTLEDDLFPGGVIPHVRSGEMHYYAVASSTEQWRQLVPLLRASIGSTITDFTGPRVPFDEDDPLAAILIDNGYTRGQVSLPATIGVGAGMLLLLSQSFVDWSTSPKLHQSLNLEQQVK